MLWLLAVICTWTTRQRPVAAVRAAGGTMISMQPCDLTKPGDCQALVDFAVRTFGRIDVLFNNAAMAYFDWLEDISDEEWDRNRRGEVDLVNPCQELRLLPAQPPPNRLQNSARSFRDSY